MPPGRFTSDIFTLITLDLRIAVSTALKTAREQQSTITYTDITVKGERGAQHIQLTAMPLKDCFEEPSGLTAIVLTSTQQVPLPVASVHYDIDSIEQALQRAQKANAEKNSFLSLMSHDMRTPLNAIMGLTYLTLDQPELPDTTRSSLLKIQDSSQYLLGIISDVLDTSMIENGKFRSQSEPVLEESLIHEVEDMILLQAEDQKRFCSVTIMNSIQKSQNSCWKARI